MIMAVMVMAVVKVLACLKEDQAGQAIVDGNDSGDS